jgi:hypothetical protein
MQGTETVVVGSEAPHSTDGFDPFGDAATRARDDVDEFAQEPPSGRVGAAATRRRGDGLTMDLDECQDDAAAQEAASRPRPRPRRFDAVVAPASEWAARMEGAARPARTFVAGQRVRHAEYGEGVLAGISGAGPRAVGTVIFDGTAGTRKFILGHGTIEAVADQAD